MKLRRLFIAVAAFALLLAKFAFDVVTKNIELDFGVLTLVRELLAAAIIALTVLFSRGITLRLGDSPVKKVGFLLILTGGMVLVVALISSLPADGFDAKNLMLLPLDYASIFLASMIAAIAIVYSVLLFLVLRDLVLQTRRKETRRNMLVFQALAGTAVIVAAFIRPLDSSLLLNIVLGLSLVGAVVNSFRLPWIIYLTKREKVITLIYTLLLFAGLTVLNAVLGTASFAGRGLLYSSHFLAQFVQLSLLFGNIYVGMAFVSTLFHLPTAEAFDRKRTEVTSLYSLSRLINRVFDFNELVDSVTTMTQQVCEAESSWLELVRLEPEPAGVEGGRGGGSWAPGYQVQAVSLKNISQEEIDTLVPAGSLSIRDVVMEERRTTVVDDLESDKRFGPLPADGRRPGSMVVVPLISHNGLIGLLYATKEAPYGFVKDDVEVISAFADQATVAIENSRLIKSSIERERLLREVMLAQEMQRRLLPQSLPDVRGLEIEAVSTPAFEVGGDYYDFIQLGPEKVGIIVGDVSGKGVSAAFYMSEMKGIFQALARMYDSPRDLVLHANQALLSSIDKHSFVSLIYGILDVRTGQMRVARAGHCPLLIVNAGGARYVRPGGMGLGLGGRHVFDAAIEEEVVALDPGDLCIFYTDGLTEARQGEEEFGYERLRDLAATFFRASAANARHTILETVKDFIGNEPNHDDLTVVVAKWTGPDRGPAGA